MADIEFVSELIVKPPREGAPDYVKCSISFRRAELREWLDQRTDEWINIVVKEARSGKWYASVDNWKPNKGGDPPAPTRAPVKDCPQPDAPAFEDDDPDAIPFN